jgi:hypothetical protein
MTPQGPRSPSSPYVDKMVSRASESLSPSGNKCSPGLAGTPDPTSMKKPSPTKTMPSPSALDATQAQNQPSPIRKKAAPPSPQSHGLGATGEHPTKGDSTGAQDAHSPQSIRHVAESLTNDPNFIKVGFHIIRFVTTIVNTEAEKADIQALRSDLDSASLWINVNSSLLFFFTAFYPL